MQPGDTCAVIGIAVLLACVSRGAGGFLAAGTGRGDVGRSFAELRTTARAVAATWSTGALLREQERSAKGDKLIQNH